MSNDLPARARRRAALTDPASAAVIEELLAELGRGPGGVMAAGAGPFVGGLKGQGRAAGMGESIAGQLWTPADLSARWGCSVGTVMDRVRTKAVPYVWLGRGDAKLTGRGAKFVRFRPKAVEDWEAKQEGYWDAAAAAPTAPKVVPAAGLLRGRKARQSPA